MQLQGVHHVTAITGDARGNVDFYTRVLGLRLAAKTVNQDDPSVYHLFYADEHGDAGSDITFFEYPHASPGRAGDGMVHSVLWRVGDDSALDFWSERLTAAGTAVAHTPNALRFADPEGLSHELVIADGRDEPLIAEHPEIPAAVALQGFEGVRAYASDPAASGLMLERLMGAERRADASWELRGERRGATITYDPPPPLRGRPSAGTVHHVAWGTTAAEHPRWWERLRAAGVRSSEIIDRHYFHSIYFPEPSGVLFEIADDGPGFTVDLPREQLGTRIILPPRFEPHRAAIEARLTPLPDPRAGWPEPRAPRPSPPADAVAS